jgi:hypothetical protein
VDLVPDPLLLKKSGNAGNRTRMGLERGSLSIVRKIEELLE